MTTKRLKRPRDPLQLAKLIGDIATGQVEDRAEGVPARAKGGKAGGKARAKVLSAKERSEIARAAASARWKK
ncbi:MAG TPA: hypothetical protein VN766_21070, partial [Stellaceae bacterium]|nr:hypothetical protein [Stellaceae bacterium]